MIVWLTILVEWWGCGIVLSCKACLDVVYVMEMVSGVVILATGGCGYCAF